MKNYNNDDKYEAAENGGDRDFNRESRPDFLGSPLGRYIDDHERVLWSGQPGLRLAGGIREVFSKNFLLGLLFIVFSALPAFDTISITVFNVIVKGLLLLVGLFLMLGKMTIIGTNLKNIYYAVTDRRVLIMINVRNVRFREIKFERIRNMKLNLRRNGGGRGTIVFYVPNYIPEYPYGKHSDRIMNTNQLLDSFVDIEDAKRVYNLINDAKSAYEDEQV
jgi:hypothetical protein